MYPQLQTPVVFIVFNRPAHTRICFARIADAKPSRLLVVADGPRAHIPGEAAICEDVRKAATAVDWPCQVEVNFSSVNMGCRDRVVSGLNWAFSLVEEAIILEDDCQADLSFFPFCQDLLNRYRGDSRIGSIAGTNLVERHLHTEDSYFFSRIFGSWGWATWRSKWQHYDEHMRNWPEVRRSGLISEVFDDDKAAAFWTRIFDSMYEKRGPNTWDYQWLYMHLIYNALVVVPRVNLITNIGFGTHATHTNGADPRLIVRSKVMTFPLEHPSSVIPLRSMDRHLQTLYSTPLSWRAIRLIRRLGKLLIHRTPTY